MGGDGRNVRQWLDSETEARHVAKRPAIVSDLSERLRPVCQHMTDAEFAELIGRLADTKLRFALIEAGHWPRPA